MKISIENYGRIHSTYVNSEDSDIDEYIDIIYNLLIATAIVEETN